MKSCCGREGEVINTSEVKGTGEVSPIKGPWAWSRQLTVSFRTRALSLNWWWLKPDSRREGKGLLRGALYEKAIVSSSAP